jgi:hypothetical protein
MRIYFMKVGFTGNWYESGAKEIGWDCGHKHRTIEAARKCKKCHCEQGGAIREYRGKKPY